MAELLGRRLRALRLRAGLSATALAGDALSVATISRIEHGTVEPSLATLRYLAARLGLATADLLVEEDQDRALLAAIDEAESWLLLDVPLLALERGMAALVVFAPAGGETELGQDAGPLRQLRWTVARAHATLDPAAAPALDALIAEARGRGDAWAVARLVAVRALSTVADTAFQAAQSALAALPPPTGDDLEQRVMRGRLLQLLARRHEAAGSVETARGLYTRVVADNEVFRHPTWAARRLLEDGAGTVSGPSASGGQRHVGDRSAPSPPSPGRALAALAAGRDLWHAAAADLARLDLQARRMADAARRLRAMQLSDVSQPGAATLGALWSEMERTLERRPEKQRTTLPSLASAAAKYELGADVIDDLVRIETALLAGRLADAEQTGALLAVAVTPFASSLAHLVWLRLALAWAEAGNAPRAARALRGALEGGGNLSS